MLNYIWAFMIIIGIMYSVITGNVQEVSNGLLEASKDAVAMCVTMLGILSFWLGIMEIGKKAGIISQLTKIVNPFVDFLFPKIPKDHKSREYITTNIIANILGLGWAATPPGLKAMEELANLEKERGNPEYTDQKETKYNKDSAGKNKIEKKNNKIKEKTNNTSSNDKNEKIRNASDEMCAFLVINISSLQLIPINIIAYRSQYGSVNPAAIVVPAIVATFVSTVVGIIFCKIMQKKSSP